MVTKTIDFVARIIHTPSGPVSIMRGAVSVSKETSFFENPAALPFVTHLLEKDRFTDALALTSQVAPPLPNNDTSLQQLAALVSLLRKNQEYGKNE